MGQVALSQPAQGDLCQMELVALDYQVEQVDLSQMGQVALDYQVEQVDLFQLAQMVVLDCQAHWEVRVQAVKGLLALVRMVGWRELFQVQVVG